MEDLKSTIEGSEKTIKDPKILDDIKFLKTNVESIKNDVTSLQGGTTVLRGDLDKVRKTVGEVESFVKKMN